MMTLSHRESPIRLRLDLSRNGFSKRADRVRGTILLLLGPAFFSIAPKVSNGMRRARADDSAFAQAEGEETTRLLEQKIASVTTPDVEGLARALGVQLVTEDDESDFSLLPHASRPAQAGQLRRLGGFKDGRNAECVLFL